MRPRRHPLLAVLLAAMLVLPLAAPAAESPVPGEGAKHRDDQAMKERVIKHIDAKIRILQTAKSCVRAAQDTKAVLACHAQERRQTKELRDRDGQGW